MDDLLDLLVDGARVKQQQQVAPEREEDEGWDGFDSTQF